MRAFHLSWFTFFLAFFGWFGIAPLMPIVREDLGLTHAQVGNTIIASVVATFFARMILGWFCDRYGARRTCTALLMLGSLPVMGIGLSQSYEVFLLFRLAIGVIGAMFVITQYHMSVMFDPNVVGAANATTAGWGNLGGGVTQIAMPLVLGMVLWLGVDEFLGWRVAMVVPGAVLFLMDIIYYVFTQDTPFGNYPALRAENRLPPASQARGAFREAAADYRVWVLFLAYGASFGVELTILNVAALYYYDEFGLSVWAAGLTAGCFGLLNIFARPLGGVVADRIGLRFGLRGRAMFLAVLLLLGGAALMMFSQATMLLSAIPLMLVLGLFAYMAAGATFAVVPLIKERRVLGSASGIVGAGGNFAAVGFGFLFSADISTQNAFMAMGGVVIAVSALVFAVRFARSPGARKAARERPRSTEGGESR